MKINFSNLITITILNLLFLFLISDLLINKADFKSYFNANIEDSPRNERSTPRDFLLPVSPAVSDIQDNRINDIMNAETIYCLSVLNNKGYEVNDLTDLGNANSIAMIFKFQVDSGIEPNGLLDSKTKTKIGCSD